MGVTNGRRTLGQQKVEDGRMATKPDQTRPDLTRPDQIRRRRGSAEERERERGRDSDRRCLSGCSSEELSVTRSNGRV